MLIPGSREPAVLQPTLWSARLVLPAPALEFPGAETRWVGLAVPGSRVDAAWLRQSFLQRVGCLRPRWPVPSTSSSLQRSGGRAGIRGQFVQEVAQRQEVAQISYCYDLVQRPIGLSHRPLAILACLQSTPLPSTRFHFE